IRHNGPGIGEQLRSEGRRCIEEGRSAERHAFRRKGRTAAQTIYSYGPETILAARLEGAEEKPGSRGLFNHGFPGTTIEFLLNGVRVGSGIGLAEEEDLAAVGFLNGQTAFARGGQQGLLPLEKHEAPDRWRTGESCTRFH